MSNLDFQICCRYTAHEPPTPYSEGRPSTYEFEIDAWHMVLDNFVGGGDFTVRGPQMNAKSIQEFAKRIASMAYLDGVYDGLMLAELHLEKERSAVAKECSGVISTLMDEY